MSELLSNMNNYITHPALHYILYLSITHTDKYTHTHTHILTIRAVLAEMSVALRANTAPRAPTYRRPLSSSNSRVL